MVFDSAGNLYLALREGNAIYRVDGKTATLHHVAGTGAQGYRATTVRRVRRHSQGRKASRGGATPSMSPIPRTTLFAAST